MFDDDLKRRVRDANHILDVVQAAVGKLTRAGRNYKACCPFHNEKTPSFNVNPEGQYFKCFGCGKSGDVFTFVMLQERVEFPEALRILAERAGIPIEFDPRAIEAHKKEKDWKSYLYKLNDSAARFYREQLFTPAGKHALEYLGKRGLNDEICARFGLGYAPANGSPLLARLQSQKAPLKAILSAGLASQRDEQSPVRDFFYDRLMFPIRDIQGRVIAFGGRILGEGEPKYLNTRDTPLFSKTKTVYGVDLAREKITQSHQAILVEGYTDVMMCHQFGVENVVACLGTAITPEHVRQLRRLADELLMLTDSDAAGARASERSLVVLLSEQVPAKVVRLPGKDKDPCDFLLARGAAPFLEALEKGTDLFDYKFERVLAENDIRSALGMKQAGMQLMELVSVVPDPILKNEYRRRVAVKLNIPEGQLQFEVRRTAETAAEVANGTAAQLSSGTAAERDLFRFLFQEPAWMDAALAQLDGARFSGAGERIVAGCIRRALGRGALPPNTESIDPGSVPSLVAREVLLEIDSEPGLSDDQRAAANSLCVDLAEQPAAGKKIDAESRFGMLIRPLLMLTLSERLKEVNRNLTHARLAGNTAEEEVLDRKAVALRKELSVLKG